MLAAVPLFFDDKTTDSNKEHIIGGGQRYCVQRVQLVAMCLHTAPSEPLVRGDNYLLETGAHPPMHTSYDEPLSADDVRDNTSVGCYANK